MPDLKLIDTGRLDRLTEKISKPIKNISAELETLKSNLSDCVGYRKFSDEWITAQHTLEDKTRNLIIEGNSKYVKDGVILNEWQEGCKIKSVGDLQVNGKYKIALTSSNYNLLNSSINTKAIDTDNVVIKNNYFEGTYKGNGWVIFKITTPKFKKNTNIIIRGKYINEIEATGKIEIFQDLNKTGTMTACDIKKGEFVAKLKLKHDTDTLIISARNTSESQGKKVVFSDLIIEKDTDLNIGIDGICNKKDILLQEPLRGIKNTKDSYDGNVITRRIKQFTLDNRTPLTLSSLNVEGDSNILASFTIDDKAVGQCDMYCDSIKESQIQIVANEEYYFISRDNKNILISLSKDKLETQDIAGISKYLSNNNVNFLYETTSPTTEILEQDITLNTYDELTHIYTDTEIQGNISFSTLVDLGSTINALEEANTANLKIIESQNEIIEEQAYSIIENDARLCMLEILN